MNDCLFCKIAQGEIPATKLYEDDTTFAFLDIHPVNPGHALVIPKTHYENIFSAPDEVMQKIMTTAKKVAHGIREGLGIEHMNITMNNGVHAGQSVFHAHVHIIPRHAGDGHTAWHGKKPYAEGEAAQVAEKIRSAL